MQYLALILFTSAVFARLDHKSQGAEIDYKSYSSAELTLNNIPGIIEESFSKGVNHLIHGLVSGVPLEDRGQVITNLNDSFIPVKRHIMTELAQVAETGQYTDPGSLFVACLQIVNRRSIQWENQMSQKVFEFIESSSVESPQDIMERLEDENQKLVPTCKTSSTRARLVPRGRVRHAMAVTAKFMTKAILVFIVATIAWGVLNLTVLCLQHPGFLSYLIRQIKNEINRPFLE